MPSFLKRIIASGRLNPTGVADRTLTIRGGSQPAVGGQARFHRIGSSSLRPLRIYRSASFRVRYQPLHRCDRLSSIPLSWTLSKNTPPHRLGWM